MTSLDATAAQVRLKLQHLIEGANETGENSVSSPRLLHHLADPVEDFRRGAAAIEHDVVLHGLVDDDDTGGEIEPPGIPLALESLVDARGGAFHGLAPLSLFDDSTHAHVGEVPQCDDCVGGL